MKFFYFTQISNSPFQYWAYPDGVQDTLEPSHQLFALCSKLHSQQPRNAVPSISVSIEEIQPVQVVRYDLLVSSPNYLHSATEDIRHGYEHGLCSQRPLEFEHSHYCKSELSNHEFGVEYRLVKHENDTLSPKPDERIVYLHYGCFCDNLPYCKTMKFIETKVAAMKLQGFNH